MSCAELDCLINHSACSFESYCDYMYMQVYPTQTIYTFEQDGIQLNLTVSYLDYSILYIVC
jgi:hypothetical protein